jgi:hypothetical protein
MNFLTTASYPKREQVGVFTKLLGGDVSSYG